MLLYYSEYHAPYHGNSIILHLEHRTNLLLVPSSDIFPLHDEHDLYEEKCLVPLVMALVTSVLILLVKSDSSVVTSLMSSIFSMFPSSFGNDKLFRPPYSCTNTLQNLYAVPSVFDS